MVEFILSQKKFSARKLQVTFDAANSEYYFVRKHVVVGTISLYVKMDNILRVMVTTNNIVETIQRKRNVKKKATTPIATTKTMTTTAKTKATKTATTICANCNKQYQQGRGIKIHLSSCKKKQATQNYLQ